ncbi:MAG: hypothetical protein OER97_07000 [Gammaproteobacteria bacterium]|nr:hypothetical protein [Gammaproteobacteria bacterium]
MIYSLGDRRPVVEGDNYFIADNATIVAGSTVLNGARIGANCLVGAHALITENKEFPDGSLIIGSPAYVVRSLQPEEVAMLKKSADIYVANARRFNSEFQPL